MPMHALLQGRFIKPVKKKSSAKIPQPPAVLQVELVKKSKGRLDPEALHCGDPVVGSSKTEAVEVDKALAGGSIGRTCMSKGTNPSAGKGKAEGKAGGNEAQSRSRVGEQGKEGKGGKQGGKGQSRPTKQGGLERKGEARRDGQGHAGGGA